MRDYRCNDEGLLGQVFRNARDGMSQEQAQEEDCEERAINRMSNVALVEAISQALDDLEKERGS